MVIGPKLSKTWTIRYRANCSLFKLKTFADYYIFKTNFASSLQIHWSVKKYCWGKTRWSAEYKTLYLVLYFGYKANALCSKSFKFKSTMWDYGSGAVFSKHDDQNQVIFSFWFCLFFFRCFLVLLSLSELFAICVRLW